MHSPMYEWTKPKMLLFMTGAPLSGKSTIAPLVAAAIRGCHLQAMDVVRLFAQELDGAKGVGERNPFVHLGSCDSFTAIGDGRYTPTRLIEGFRANAESVCAPLFAILPRLEIQGVQDLLMEGVQLTPELVSPRMREHHWLIVIVSDAQMLTANRHRVFGRDRLFEERYATDRLLLIQAELLRQARFLPSRIVIIVRNTGTVAQATGLILRALFQSGRIQPVEVL